MPSRVRALMIRTSGSAPSSCDRAARTRPYIMIDTASAQFGGHGRDLADPLVVEGSADASPRQASPALDAQGERFQQGQWNGNDQRHRVAQRRGRARNQLAV